MAEWTALAEPLLRTAGRMGAALTWGVPAGLLLGLLLSGTWCRAPARVWGWLRRAVIAVRTVPAIGWLPLLALWPGRGEPLLLLLCGVGAALVIGSATDRAIRGIPPVLLQAAATLGARGWRLRLHVVLPAALPRILGGLRAGWYAAWGTMLAAEILLEQGGLGSLLRAAMAAADPAAAVRGLAAAMALGLLVDRGLLASVERAVRRRWGAQLS